MNMKFIPLSSNEIKRNPPTFASLEQSAQTVPQTLSVKLLRPSSFSAKTQQALREKCEPQSIYPSMASLALEPRSHPGAASGDQNQLMFDSRDRQGKCMSDALQATQKSQLPGKCKLIRATSTYVFPPIGDMEKNVEGTEETFNRDSNELLESSSFDIQHASDISFRSAASERLEPKSMKTFSKRTLKGFSSDSLPCDTSKEKNWNPIDTIVDYEEILKNMKSLTAYLSLKRKARDAYLKGAQPKSRLGTRYLTSSMTSRRKTSDNEER